MIEPVTIGDCVLYHGDNRDVMRQLPDNSIDSVVTDPPYALVSIVKRFGGENAAPAKGNDAYMRASAGFMGKQWDTGEVAFSEEFWAEVLRVLKPGGHVAAFGASRGYHRMACAIEDAGFEIRDSVINVIDPESPVINFMQSLNDEQLGAFLRCLDDAEFGGTLAWMYGTGFPKSHNVALSIDKECGAVGHLAKSFNTKGAGDRADEFAANGRDFSIRHTPATDAARQWEGWGTALKPAFEPIVLARKPLSEGTVAANVLKWGTGALNIDGCRIGAGGEDQRRSSSGGDNGLAGTTTFKIRARSIDEQKVQGRWPANVVHDGSDEVVGAFPSSNGQQGRAKIGGAKGGSIYGKFAENVSSNPEPRNDSGSAARFFYSAKASRQDRAGSKHPTVKPVSLMEWLATLITPPGGTILDPFAGSGTTGAAARNKGFRAVLIEREAEYVEDIKRRLSAPIVVAAVAAQQPANDNQPAAVPQRDLFGEAA